MNDVGCASRCGGIRDAERTKRALLRAARSRFRDHGFDAVALRDVAQDAGVDASLISRYFGGKSKLFQAVLEDIGSGLSMLEGPRNRFGERVASALFERDGELRDGVLITVRAMGSDTAKPMTMTIFAGWVAAMADWIDRPNREGRQAIATSLVLGLLVQGDLASLPAAGTPQGDFLQGRVASILQAVVDD